MSKEYFTEVAEKVVADRLVVDESLIRDLAFSFSNMYSNGYNNAKNNGERREPYAELKEYKLPISAKSRSLIERVTAGSLVKEDELNYMLENIENSPSGLLKGDELKSVLENVGNSPHIPKQTMTDGSSVTSDHRDLKDNGQQKGYVVLSFKERARGFVRPVRSDYVHLKCGQKTSMDINIAETFARNPKFYSGTFCCNCGKHYPLKEFVWEGTDEEVGS